MKILFYSSLVLILGGSTTAGAQEIPVPFVDCVLSAVGDVSPEFEYKIFTGNPIEDRNARVEISGKEPYQRDPFEVTGTIQFHTWTTYLAEFEVNQDKILLEISYLPGLGIGRLTDKRGEHPVACFFKGNL